MKNIQSKYWKWLYIFQTDKEFILEPQKASLFQYLLHLLSLFGGALLSAALLHSP